MTESGRIAGAFATARSEGRAVRIPFLSAGDPVPSLTVPLCEALARAGADIIELGVPFSDPLADGPTIQRSSQRALAHGTGLSKCLDLARDVRERIDTALVIFSYYNPILKMGEEVFVRKADEAGIDGVLVTDLPLEEGAGLRRLLIRRGIDPILLVAPTSGAARIETAAREARGFIYYISRTGVTGAREALPEGLTGEVAAVRAAASLPVAVGFGISSPEQVREVGRVADGVVVGSALVEVVEKGIEAGMGDKAFENLPGLMQQAAARLFGTA
ncbi:MAG: tryptophan synthase subunit alpha [Acidobacteriota bacterium]